MTPALQGLLRHPDIWRAGHQPEQVEPGLPSHYPELDRYLPGGGWPMGALTEILCEEPGSGELSLLLPALAELSRNGRWLAWMTPPHVPYAPALAGQGVDLSHVLWVRTRDQSQALWAAEQSLRSGSCGAVLLWPGDVSERRLRRLQLAAEQGRAWGILVRPMAAAAQHSPAALRLRLKPSEQGLNLDILKCRGGLLAQGLELSLAGR